MMKLGFFCKHNTGLETVRAFLLNGHKPVFVIAQEPLIDDVWGGQWLSELKDLCFFHKVSFVKVTRVGRQESLEFIQNASPDLILSVLFTEIIPQRILDIPRFGIINCHPSLLPRYRGPHPINWAIINGEKEAGLTLHYMTSKLDKGDIVWQQAVSISFTDGIAEVSRKIMSLIPKAAIDVVQQLQNNTLRRWPQNEALASYFPRRTEFEDVVDWRASAVEIYNLIRGLGPPLPGALSWINGKKIVLRWGRPCVGEKSLDQRVGTVLGFEDNAVIIATGAGNLRLSRVDIKKEINLNACEVLSKFVRVGDCFNR